MKQLISSTKTMLFLIIDGVSLDFAAEILFKKWYGFLKIIMN
jgi:hypothetical protein